MYKQAKAWLNSCNMVWNTKKDNKNESLSFEAGFNTVSRCNPFAGSFQQYLIMDGLFEVSDGHMTLVIDNIKIQDIYAGFGAKKEEFNIEDRISRLQEAAQTKEEAKNNTSLSKKERKKIIEDSEDTIDEIEDQLNKGGEELKERLDKLDKLMGNQ